MSCVPGGALLPKAFVSPLSSSDENANLGTVMRYEEIGEWAERLETLGGSSPNHWQLGEWWRLENPALFEAGSILRRTITPS